MRGGHSAGSLGWATWLAKANGIRSIPQTFLIDRNGKVRYASLRGPNLARRIQELIDEDNQRK